MKVCIAVAFLLVCLPGGFGQQHAAQLTPAQQRIEAARKGITDHPDKYQPYNDLAFALCRRARESSDRTYFQQAAEALDRSFRLAPENLEGQKVQVLLLINQGEYSQARDKARALNHKMPDDVLLWGYIADADIALGDYDDAGKSAQWMLDLRPGNLPGLVRGARLRTIYGDLDGAMDFLKQAYQQTPPNESEDLAWYLAQMADLELATGKVDDAEKLLAEALQDFPGYWLALEGLARVRTAQHKYAEAVELLKRRNQSAPSMESLYALAEALERAGLLDEAKATYAQFEGQARTRIEKADNANRLLVSYYIEHAHKPDEALRIARLEIMRRHGVETLDAYAWALYANGDYARARSELQKALAVGVRDAALLYHAGAIAAKLKEKDAATRYYKQSLDLNPFSDVASAARDALHRLAPS